MASLPQPHRLDVRSLASFRILVSLFLLHDLYRRLEHGRIDLAWYYSDSSDGSSSDSPSYFYPAVLDAADSPHGSPVHKVWFYRGSPYVACAIFAVTAILTILYGLGTQHFQWISVLLWLCVSNIQNKSPHLGDGSESYSRNMLLWTCCCGPHMTRAWSVNSYYEKKQMIGASKKTEDEGGSTNRDNRIGSGVVSSYATLGISLQVPIMYIGAVHRRFSGNMWLYPDLTAVYYAFNRAFGTRQYAADLARQFPQVTRAMTAAGMAAEISLPLLLILAPCEGKSSRRHIPAVLLALFHMSLYAAMSLFNWQFFSAICCVLFVPPVAWDNWLGTFKGSLPWSGGRISPKSATLQAKVRKCISAFFLFYMLYNAGGNYGIIAKHDDGDIGEFLRFNQWWVMYGPNVGTVDKVGMMIGVIDPPIEGMNDEGGMTNTQAVQRVDLMKAIRTNDWSSASILDETEYAKMRQELPGNMASRFPSWRWEVAMKDWIKDDVKPAQFTRSKRSVRLGKTLCAAANDAFLQYGRKGSSVVSVELTFWTARTVSFEKATIDHRFDRIGKDLIISVDC
uniref:HTTM domain-containing protein n=1 Tax=Odontella aurita TaxID=265563 RepID=A0A7S4HU90_9STRA